MRYVLVRILKEKMSLDADPNSISLNDSGPSKRTINSADYELFELFDINH